MIVLRRTNSISSDFHRLTVILDQELARINGKDNEFFVQFNQPDQIEHVIVAYVNEIPVGCGAIKSYSSKIAEIKRMFVHAQFRRTGIASAILNELERWAMELRFEICILETDRQLFPAIALYMREGYEIIPNYEPYTAITSSICFQKVLQTNY